jgi:hypothetical protein
VVNQKSVFCSLSGDFFAYTVHSHVGSISLFLFPNFTTFAIRGRRQKRYIVVVITLRYVFSLSHNASALRRKVIAFYSYRSRFMETVIASYSYRSRLIGNVIAFYSYSSDNITKAITCNAVTF